MESLPEGVPSAQSTDAKKIKLTISPQQYTARGSGVVVVQSIQSEQDWVHSSNDFDQETSNGTLGAAKTCNDTSQHDNTFSQSWISCQPCSKSPCQESTRCCAEVGANLEAEAPGIELYHPPPSGEDS